MLTIRRETRQFVSCLAALVAAGLFVFSAPSFAQSQSEAIVPNRITQPINPDSRVALQHNVHPLAQARFDQGTAPGSMATGRIMLVLRRSDAQETALKQFLSDVQNPASPSYRKWLTPTQFGKQYGISDTDLTTVTAWLQSQGFTVDKVPQARNVVLFSGNMAQIQQAFHTSIHRYTVNGETHFANVTDPQIPAALAPVIGGIASLHDFRPRPFASIKTTGHFDPDTKRIQPDLTLHDQQGTNYLFVDPADAATIYDTPNSALNGNYKTVGPCDAPGASINGCAGYGVLIGIAGDSNIAEDEVAAYRANFLPFSYGGSPPNIIIDGNDPGENGDAVEALLDLEVSAGIAPGASTNFYTAANTDLQSGLFLAIYRALDDNAVSILNVSFGQCEAFIGTSGNQQILNAWEQAAAQGISITVSTGDSGSAGCDNPNNETVVKNGLAVNGLASTSYNIAVGGTDFNALQGAFPTYVDTNNYPSLYYRTARSYIPESPWNDSPTTNSGSYATNTPTKDSKGNTDIVAGGGGISSCTQSTISGSTVTCTANSGYPQPSFQNGIVPGSLFSSGVKVRAIPDVSFLAANAKYGAVWLVCLDNAIKGLDTPGGDCATTNGQFTDATTFSGVGGTSAAAPAFAGMLALVVQSQGGSRLGQVDNVLYNLAAQPTIYSAVFHDVTTGNNSVICQSGSPNCGSNGFISGYNAGSGYDAATGLGSIDVSQLIANWGNATFTSSSISLTINGSTDAVNVQHGTPLNFTVSVDPSATTGDVVITNSLGEINPLITCGSDAAPGVGNGGLSFGGQQQSFLTLSNGTASGTSNMLLGGSYLVCARYGGNSKYAFSVSNSIPVNITPESSTTALRISFYDAATGRSYNGSVDNIPYGLFNFAVAQSYGNGSTISGGIVTPDGVPKGTVDFYDKNNSLGSSAVASNGAATYTNYQVASNSFVVGSHSISAGYSGDASFNASTSNAVSFTVVTASTTTTASSSATSVGSSASVTVSVAVEADSLGIPPSGTVQFYKGSTALGNPVPLTQAYSPTGLVQSVVKVSITGSQLASIKTAKLNRTAVPWELSSTAVAMACVVFLTVPARRRSWRSLFALAVAALLISSVTACGSGSDSSGGGGGGVGTSVTITAKYSGDTNYTASTSAAISLTVTK